MKLYDELADWWHLMSAPEEYAEEAAIYDRAIREVLEGPQVTMLELGCGGGNNASHLKASWELVLSDVANGMLAASKGLNPECEHHLGDMRTIRLERTFDAVFIHDAICYMTSLADLDRALETAAVHTRPGGVVLVAPDETRERYKSVTSHGGHDGDDGRAMRYLEWSYDPDPSDCTTVTDYSYLLRDADGSVRTLHDRHVHGLFGRDEWLSAIERAGLRDARGVMVDHSEVEPGTYELFLAVKP